MKKIYLGIISLAFIIQPTALMAEWVIYGSGMISNPDRDFENSYDKSSEYSYAFGAGYLKKYSYFWDKIINLNLPLKRYDHANENLYSICYYKDRFAFKDEIKNYYGLSDNENVKVKSVVLKVTGRTYLIDSKYFTFSIITGGGIGGARFKMNDSYAAVGQDTLTILRHENNETEFTYFYSPGLGLRLFNTLSIDYTYDLALMEKDVAFWHFIANQFIFRITATFPFIITEQFVSETTAYSKYYKVVKTLYLIAFNILHYYYNYDTHNWPFDDNRPIYFNRHLITVSFEF